MGLIKSLKGKVQYGTESSDDQNSHAGATEPATNLTRHDDDYSTRGEKLRMFGNDHTSSSQSSHDQNSFNPPSEPPPSHRNRQNQDQNLIQSGEGFIPPSGPPPSHLASKDTEFSPPAGPPPSKSNDKPSENPPPYHDWTVIPDTSLLPPPPAIPQDYSPTNNASYDSAAAAHTWCAQNPVYSPTRPSNQVYTAVQQGNISLDLPPLPQSGRHNQQRSITLRQAKPGRHYVKTNKSYLQSDAILLSTLPLFFAAVDGQLNQSSSSSSHDRPKKQIYFEVQLSSVSGRDSGIAIGFAAKPYPPWRLPGWHRASLAVHGDDGRRFINDSWGGQDFVSAFRSGDRLGIGMWFSSELNTDAHGERNVMKTTAFFSRNGRIEGQWEIDEERDAERDEGGVEGLLGDGDLYAAVGVFGGVDFEVLFDREEWIYRT